MRHRRLKGWSNIITLQTLKYFFKTMQTKGFFQLEPIIIVLVIYGSFE